VLDGDDCANRRIQVRDRDPQTRSVHKHIDRSSQRSEPWHRARVQQNDPPHLPWCRGGPRADAQAMRILQVSWS
jgi:hypothetical protein